MDTSENLIPDYGYSHAQPTWDSSKLWEVVRSELSVLPRGARVFDLGCGNGALAAHISGLGFSVTGVDPSQSGVDVARRSNPGVHFAVGSVDDDLVQAHGVFPALVSLEVIEHCYSPKRYAQAVHELLEPGGIAIVSTPYHGYLKNLALAVTGQMDRHFTALWEGGHIKFFSLQTLKELFKQHGLQPVRVHRVGRIPPLAKSMILVVKRE